MPGLDDALRRLADDPTFGDALRSDPTSALRGYDLSAEDLDRLDKALGHAPMRQTLFDPPAEAPATGAPAQPAPGLPPAGPGVAPTPAAGLGARGLALIAGGVLVAGAAGVALGVGLGGGSRTPLAADEATYRTCSDATHEGTPLGVLHRGDTVLVIGRSAGNWLVVRNPQNLAAPAWMPAGTLAPKSDVAGLPELTCVTALAAAASGAPTAQSAPTTSATPNTSAAATAATPTSGPAGSPPPAPATTRATANRPSTAAVAPTPAPDTTGPTVQAFTDLSLFYSEGGAACGTFPQYLSVIVRSQDPSGIGSTTVTWTGAGKTGTATPVAPEKWSIGSIYSTHNGVVPITVTITVKDSRGNSTTTTKTVDFRQIAEVCIG